MKSIWTIAITITLMTTACGGRCTEGTTQACACQGGLTGVQTCNAENAFGACDCGQLGEAEARQLVESQPDFTDGVMCGVQVNEVAHGRYSLSMFRSECLDALVAAGVAERGGCAVPTCGETEVSAVAPAHVDGIYLRFRCGSVALNDITSITTTGNSATFTYDRTVTLDHALVDRVSACRLDLAEDGQAQRERTARRDDAGHWSLVTPAR